MKKLSIVALLTAVSVSVLLAPVSPLIFFSLVCVEDPLRVFLIQQQSWNFLVSKETASVDLEIFFSDILLYPLYLFLRGEVLYRVFLMIIAWILSLSAYYLASRASGSSAYGVVAGLLSTTWLLYSLQYFYSVHVVVHIALFLLAMALAAKASEARSFLIHALLGVLAGCAMAYDIYLGILCAILPLLFLEKKSSLKYYPLVIAGLLPSILVRDRGVDQRLLCYSPPGSFFSDIIFFAVILFSAVALYKKYCREARGLLLAGGLLGLLCVVKEPEVYLWYFSLLSAVFLVTVLGAFDRDVVSRTTALIIVGKKVARLKMWFSLRRVRVSLLTVFVVVLVLSATAVIVVESGVESIPQEIVELRYRRTRGAVLWVPRNLYKEYYLNTTILPYAPALGPSLSSDSIRYKYLLEVVSEKRCPDLPLLLYVSGVSTVAVVGPEAELLSDYLSEEGLEEVYSTRETAVFSAASKRVRFAKRPLLVLGDYNFLDTLVSIVEDYNISWESVPPVVFVKSEECLKNFNGSPLIFYNCDYRALALELYLAKYDVLSEKNAIVRGEEVLVLEKGEEYEFHYSEGKNTEVYVWVKVLLNASGGVLKVKVGGKVFEVITKRSLFNPVYVWVDLGKVFIGESPSKVNVVCVEGRCVLSKLLVVPEVSMLRAVSEAKRIVEERGFFYVLDGEYCFTGMGFRYGVDEDYHRRALLCPPYRSFRGSTEIGTPLSGHYKLTFMVSKVAREVFVSYGVFGTKFFPFNIPLGTGYSTVVYETEAKEGLYRLFIYILNNQPQCVYLDYVLVEPANASLAEYLRQVFSYSFNGTIVSESPSEIVVDLSEEGIVVLHEDFSENWVMVLSSGEQIEPMVCDLGVCCFKAPAGRARIVYKSVRADMSLLKNLFMVALLALAGLGDLVRAYGRRK